MADVQQATAGFFIPVGLAYGAALVGWWAMVRTWPALWPQGREFTTDRPWLDLALVFVTAAGIFALNRAHAAGFLFPQPDGVLGTIAWSANVLIIFAPMFLITFARGQGMDTLFLSPRGLGVKLGVGLALSVASVLVFIALRNEWGRLDEIAARSASPGLFARYFIPVLLEGVALAFFFVRVRWALGLWPALLIPAVLFALGHMPNALEAGRSVGYIVSFFVVNSGIVVAVLYVIQRSQDVLWLTMVHYFMDIAIEAF